MEYALVVKTVFNALDGMTDGAFISLFRCVSKLNAGNAYLRHTVAVVKRIAERIQHILSRWAQSASSAYTEENAFSEYGFSSLGKHLL